MRSPLLLALLISLALPGGEAEPWHFGRIRAAEAQAALAGKALPLIAVIDDGFRATHQDLAAALDGAVYNARAPGSPAPVSNHGTGCASIAIAPKDGKGMLGVAAGARLLAIASTPAIDTEPNVPGLAAALRYAVERKAGVISASTLWELPDAAVVEALQAAAAAGIPVVIAAGNSAVDIDSPEERTPGCIAQAPRPHLRGVIVVGGHDRDNRPAMNHGQLTVLLHAPATGIQVAKAAADDAYGAENGSSEATPQVAGVMAMLRALHPEEQPLQLTNRLLRGAVREPALAGLSVCGGRLDALGAVQTTTARPFNDDPQDAAVLAELPRAFGWWSDGATSETTAVKGLPPGRWLWWRWQATTALSGKLVRLPGAAPCRIAVCSGASAPEQVLAVGGEVAISAKPGELRWIALATTADKADDAFLAVQPQWKLPGAGSWAAPIATIAGNATCLWVHPLPAEAPEIAWIPLEMAGKVTDGVFSGSFQGKAGVGADFRFFPCTEAAWFTHRAAAAGELSISATGSVANVLLGVFRAEAGKRWVAAGTFQLKTQSWLVPVAAGEELRIGAGLQRRLDLLIVKDGLRASKGCAGQIRPGRIAVEVR